MGVSDQKGAAKEQRGAVALLPQGDPAPSQGYLRHTRVPSDPEV